MIIRSLNLVMDNSNYFLILIIFEIFYFKFINMKKDIFYKCAKGPVFAKYIESTKLKMLIVTLIYLKTCPCHN